MKSLVQTVILILIILIGVPLSLGLLFGGDKGETLKAEEMKNKMDTPNTIKVWMDERSILRNMSHAWWPARCLQTLKKKRLKLSQ